MPLVCSLSCFLVLSLSQISLYFAPSIFLSYLVRHLSLFLFLSLSPFKSLTYSLFPSLSFSLAFVLFLVLLESHVLSSASLSPRPKFCTSHALVSFDFNLVISLSLSSFLFPQFAPTYDQSLSSLIILPVKSPSLLHLILSLSISLNLFSPHLSSF